MATAFTNTLVPSVSTDALMQAACTFFENALVTTGGWVVTGDTGQTPPATILHPAGTNQFTGYRVYRMNDALQATYPVFMRIDFGSNPFSIALALKFTVGTGSNGAGVITGQLIVDFAANGTGNYSSTTQATNSYASCAPNRAAFAMYIQSATNGAPVVFAIERTKDANGNDTGNGLLLVYVSEAANGALDRSAYRFYAGGSQPNVEQGLAYVLSPNNPSETFGGSIPVGVIIHFAGVSQQPGTNILIVKSSDVGVESNFTMPLYGVTHTWQQLNAFIAYKGKTQASGSSSAAGVPDPFSRIAMRYD